MARRQLWYIFKAPFSPELDPDSDCLDCAGDLSFNDGYVDGNYGIADIVAGLQWVNDHIKAFGGNPKNVTVFGQSAGGESVMDVIKSPKAAGPFSAAIIHSGALGPAVTQGQVINVTSTYH